MFKMLLFKKIRNKFDKIQKDHNKILDDSLNIKILLGKLLTRQVISESSFNSNLEFGVFSQWGDDGIIQWLIHNLKIENHYFVEFGVEDYTESNTRFLLHNNNWSGLIIDSSEDFIQKIKKSKEFWQYDIDVLRHWVTKDNIDGILAKHCPHKDIGILSIDIDGNDYWIWESINSISPIIVIIEYNSVFGMDRSITIPYNELFNRTKAHSSNLYFGASLKALINLSKEKNYEFIGCSSSGNNAYFVRKDKLNDTVKKQELQNAYILSKFKESRDNEGNLSFISGRDRYNEIKGLDVYNTETGKIENL